LHHDQEQSSIFSGGTLTVIFVAIVAVVFYNFARNLAHFTETVHHPDVEVHDTVAERIRPFGRVKLPGDELAPGEICIVCHGNGIGGAPMLNDRAIWVSRLAQGMETLYLHAIEGYTGATGYMPPKGARLDLSDVEVNRAVDYMLSQIPD
jgi:cytochrome c5